MSLRPYVGKKSDSWGRKPFLVLGAVDFVIASVLYIVCRNFALITVLLLFHGVGFAYMSPSISAVLIDRIPPEELGSAFGVYTAAFEGGIAFGSILMGPVTTSLGFTVSFVVVGAITLAGALFVALAYGVLVARGA